jgi:protein involved in sex pheromone biosynthesis
MKNALALALLASAFVLSGCNTSVGVDNAETREGQFSNVTGILVTRYNADPEAVFNSVKRTLDSMRGTLRTGETDERGANKELISVTVFARTVGDEITKAAYTKVTVKYGFFGNLPESQQIVSKISSNLRR